MKSWITIDISDRPPMPEGHGGPDLRFPEALPKLFIEEYTQPGDVVLDPFAGFGTAPYVAQSLGRIGVGVEFDKHRQVYAASRLTAPSQVILGNSLHLTELCLARCAFSFTSPPFMGSQDDEDPLANYSVPSRGYAAYLSDLQTVYGHVNKLLLPGGRAVMDVCNIRLSYGLTTLAWDVARAVGEVMDFEREIVLCWEDGCGFGYNHSYALVFGRREG